VRRRSPLLHRLGDAASSIGRRPPTHPAVRVLVQGGLATLVLGFLVYTVIADWHQLQEHHLHLTVAWLLPAFIVLVAFQAGTGLLWLLALRMLKQSPDPIGAELAWVKSLLARYVPGGILFVVSRVVLTERVGVARRITLSALAYETGLAFAAAAALSTWLIFDPTDRSEEWLGWAGLAAMSLTLVVLQPRFFEPMVNRLLRAFGRQQVPELIGPSGVLGLFALYVGVFSLSGIGMWCVARAIYPASAGDMGVIVSAQALAFCAAVITLVFPGGLGIRDGAFAWAITPIVPGDSFAVAAAIALAGRLVWTASEVAYYGIIAAASRGIGTGLTGDSKHVDHESPEDAGSERVEAVDRPVEDPVHKRQGIEAS
jgi:hypothetical protein